MSSPSLVDATEVATEKHASRRGIIVRALLVWLASGIASAILLVTREAFVRSHRWLPSLVLVATLIASSLVLLLRDQISWNAAGICFPIYPTSWAFSLLAVLGIQVVGTIVLALLNAPDTFASSLSTPERIVWVCALIPLSEELFLRGWFQTAYLRASRPTSAVLASAAVFAAMHLFVSTSLSRTVPTVCAAFLSGVVYARVRQASGSIAPAVFMHAAFNASRWLIAKPVWLLVSRTLRPN